MLKKKEIESLSGPIYNVAFFFFKPQCISHVCSRETKQKKQTYKKPEICVLPSTVLPVPCYSEKINLCWKVQTDDKEPNFSYCISYKVRHGQT